MGQLVGRPKPPLVVRDEDRAVWERRARRRSTAISQLDQLLAACDITLDADEVTHLEELYRPLENLLLVGYS